MFFAIVIYKCHCYPPTRDWDVQLLLLRSENIIRNLCFIDLYDTIITIVTKSHTRQFMLRSKQNNYQRSQTIYLHKFQLNLSLHKHSVLRNNIVYTKYWSRIIEQSTSAAAKMLLHQEFYLQVKMCQQFINATNYLFEKNYTF